MRHEAIRNLYPNVSVVDDTLGVFDFDGKPIAINEQEVEAEIVRLKAEYEAKQYQRQRAKAYPSIQEQLDTLYHQGYDGWKATIEAVKQEFPKP